MTTIITRLYENKKTAEAVVSRLKADVYLDRDIDIVAPPAATAKSKPSLSRIKEAITGAGVYPNAAALYAPRIASGEALVVVRAPLGKAVRAVALVDEFKSIDAGVKYQEVHIGTQDRARTRRDGGYLPELLGSNQTIMTGETLPGLMKTGTPFSSMFGIPLLIESGRRTRLMTNNSTPFSSLLGLGLLIRQWPHAKLITENTTPFSSLFGLPLLTKRR